MPLVICIFCFVIRRESGHPGLCKPDRDQVLVESLDSGFRRNDADGLVFDLIC